MKFMVWFCARKFLNQFLSHSIHFPWYWWKFFVWMDSKVLRTKKNMSFSFLQLLYSTFRLFKFLIRKCRQEEEMKVIQIGKEAIKLCCYIICICILFIKWLLVLIICVTLQDRTSASKINDLSRYDMNKSMSYA